MCPRREHVPQISGPSVDAPHAPFPQLFPLSPDSRALESDRILLVVSAGRGCTLDTRRPQDEDRRLEETGDRDHTPLPRGLQLLCLASSDRSHRSFGASDEFGRRFQAPQEVQATGRGARAAEKGRGAFGRTGAGPARENRTSPSDAGKGSVRVLKGRTIYDLTSFWSGGLEQNTHVYESDMR